MTRRSKNGIRSLFPSMQIRDETKSPRQVRHMSIDFMIHQVSQTDECSNKSGWNNQFVESPQHTAMTDMFGIKIYGDDDTQCTSMACQSAFPYLEYLNRVCKIITRCIKKNMS